MDKKIKIIVVIVLALIISLSSIIVFEPREHEEKNVVDNFNAYSYIYVQANLKNNSLYSTPLRDPGFVYTSILKNLSISLQGQFLSNSNQTLLIRNSITIVSASPGWEKTVLCNETTVKVNKITDMNPIPIVVNISNLYNESVSIDKELKYPPGNTALLISSRVDNLNYSVSSETNATIGISTDYYTISYGSPISVKNLVTTDNVGGDPPLINLSLFYGYLGLISAAGIAVVLIGVVYMQKKHDVIKDVMDEYGDKIIEVNYLPINLIPVNNFTELTKLSDLYYEPIFYYSAGKTFFVKGSDLGYFYTFDGENK